MKRRIKPLGLQPTSTRFFLVVVVVIVVSLSLSLSKSIHCSPSMYVDQLAKIFSGLTGLKQVRP